MLGLTSEALQELRFAADRQGISNEEFTKSIQQMNKFVGQARVNTGALYSILQKSNPALLEQLKTVDSSEQAFDLLVHQIDKMPNQLDKAALANAAFGRSGQAFLIMAENGVKGIQDLREEARKYGNVISGEAAAASEKFVDSMTNLKSSLMAVRNRALLPLLDKLQPLIQKAADWVAVNQDMINLKIEKTFNVIGKAVKIVSRGWDSGLIPALLAGLAAFKAITTGLAAYQAVMTTAKAVQIALNVAMAANPIGLIIVGIAALTAGLVLLIKNWDKVKEKILNVWKKIKEPFEKVANFFGKGVGGSADFSVAAKESSGVNGQYAGLVTPNAGIIQSTTTNRSEVAIGINGLPQGSTVRQRGHAPNVTLNYGYSAGGLSNAH